MKLVFLILSLLAVVSCGRKSGNTTKVGSAGVAGAGVIGGRVTIYQDCGSNTAQISIGNSTGNAVATQNIPNGGSFNFQLTPGSYHMYAGAGSCSVSTMNQGMLQTGYNNYNVCLSRTSCGGAYGKMNVSMNETAKPLLTGLASFCTWKTWGCADAGYPASGDSLFESNFRVVGKKATVLKLDLEYSSGNAWVLAVPALEDKSWNIEAQANAVVKAAEVDYENLSVRSQIQRSALQFDSGFCAKGSELATKTAEYAKLQGFSEASADAFAKRAAKVLPAGDSFCAYPQDESQIGKSLVIKASKPVELRRLWFAFSPSSESASVKKPKQDALALAKKSNQTRQIANSADVTIEDLGLGFLIQK